MTLISEMIAGVCSSDSRPKTISAIAIVSTAFGPDVTEPMNGLSESVSERVDHVEMPRVERGVVRLADRPAGGVELRERLRELDEVLEVVVGRVAALDPLAHERAAVDRGEDHVLAADVDASLGIARLEVELGRSLGDLLEDPVGVEADELALDLLSGAREELQRLGVQELDPELADDAPPAAFELGQGGLVEDLVAGQVVDQHSSLLQSSSLRVLPSPVRADLERQPKPLRRLLGARLQLGGRLLCQPDDSFVVRK